MLNLRHSRTLYAAFASLFLLLFVGLTQVSAATVYGLTATNQLIKFDSATPATVTSVAITGTQAGENILGIDFRPATGELFAIGSASRLYTINTTTGVATQVGSAGAFALSGTDFGFDFNPVPDRIRVVSNTGQNLRLNPNDGTLSATDTPLNPGAPNVVGAAYTNSFAGTATTTLYVIDSTTDTLYTQGGINGTPSPNAGTLTAIGPLGINVTNEAGFDIAPGDSTAYAALQVVGNASSGLYRINLTTGAATLVGTIGGGLLIRDIAVIRSSASNTTSALDFDGDNKADYAVFRPSNNTFYVSRSTALGTLTGVPFGLASDVITPGDYDGDGKADYAVWRPSTGTFFVLRSLDGSVQSFQFGLNGDEPVARDYDGDGKTDFAVVRRTAGKMTWFINNSLGGTFRAQQFGLDTDITAPGDYDGDGKFDLGVFRGNGVAQATFFTLRSTAGFGAQQFGIGSDFVVPGDYDGDGKTDFAVVRQGSQYNWYILRSSDGGLQTAQFGASGDLAVQADYDGDNRTDIAVWRPTNGAFFVLRSSTGTPNAYVFGQNGDYPIANYDTH